MLRTYSITSKFHPNETQLITSSSGDLVVYQNPLRNVEKLCILQEKNLNPNDYTIDENLIPENIMEEELLGNSPMYCDGIGNTSISY